jgi:CO/xanthine dehydrogenase FAD-binding subunit
MAAAAAQVELDDDGCCARASFGIGGGGSVPRAFAAISAGLVGTRLDDASVTNAVHDAVGEMDFPGDLHASSGYRRHLATTLATRALRAACERARNAR